MHQYLRQEICQILAGEALTATGRTSSWKISRVTQLSQFSSDFRKGDSEYKIWLHIHRIPLVLRMLKGKFSLPCCLNLMLNLFEQTLWEISKSTWEVIRENILFYYGLLGGHTVTDPHGLLWPLLWFKFAQDWWLIWNYLPIVPDILTLLRGQRLEIKHPFVSDCLCITDWSTASEWADLSVSLRLPSHQN